ncbi:MAG: hypothetical protein ACQET8_22625 [Bacillota bacterium]
MELKMDKDMVAKAFYNTVKNQNKDINIEDVEYIVLCCQLEFEKRILNGIKQIELEEKMKEFRIEE